MKQHKKDQRQSAAPALDGQNWNNPFIGLKIDLPEPPKPPPPPPPTEEEKKQAALSKEDLELLKAFGGDIAVGHDDSGNTPRSRERVSFQLRRKGRGGKTVTCVQGLAGLELPEQMELCSRIKEALGIGAHFLEGTLELQGDQVQRATQWFEKQGFRTRK